MWKDELMKILLTELAPILDYNVMPLEFGTTLVEITPKTAEFIEKLLKEQVAIDKAIAHKIASSAYERDFTTYDEVERMYSLAPEPTGSE